MIFFGGVKVKTRKPGWVEDIDSFLERGPDFCDEQALTLAGIDLIFGLVQGGRVNNIGWVQDYLFKASHPLQLVAAPRSLIIDGIVSRLEKDVEPSSYPVDHPDNDPELLLLDQLAEDLEPRLPGVEEDFGSRLAIRSPLDPGEPKTHALVFRTELPNWSDPYAESLEALRQDHGTNILNLAENVGRMVLG